MLIAVIPLSAVRRPVFPGAGSKRSRRNCHPAAQSQALVSERSRAAIALQTEPSKASIAMQYDRHARRGLAARSNGEKPMSLARRHALVTGSTSGIGLAIARALAKEGADVVINGFGDKTAIEGERVEDREGIRGQGFYDPADMSKGAEIAAMIADTQKNGLASTFWSTTPASSSSRRSRNSRPRSGTRSSPSTSRRRSIRYAPPFPA